MNVYKIIHVGEGHDGRPVRRSITGSKYSVEYKVGVWCMAPIGGLLCMDNLEDAMRFMRRASAVGTLGSVTELWLCEVADKVELPPGHFGPTNTSAIKSLWGGAYTTSMQQIMVKWPAGTCAFKRVKLIRLEHTLVAK